VPPLSRSAFAAALGDLSRADLAAFVAAAERARGRSATVVDGGEAVVVDDGRRERRLWVHDPGWRGRPPDPPADADGVTTPLRDPPDPGVPVVDADDLRDLALYGVPKSARAELFAAHLGRSPTTTDRDAPVGRAAALVVALVVAAGVATAAVAVGPVDSPAAGDSRSSAPAASVTTPDPDEPRRYPPGVSAFGVSDPRTLSRAHAEAVAGASYTVASNRTVRYANDTVRSRLAVRFRLAEDRSYLVRVDHDGPTEPWLTHGPTSGAYWSNGTVSAQRLSYRGDPLYDVTRTSDVSETWRDWRAVALGGASSPVAAYERAFAGLRTGTTTTVVPGADGPARVLVRGSGDPPDDGRVGRDARNATLVAEVNGEGLVESLLLRYDATVDGQPVRVTWRVRYDDVGATTVERPPWLDRALAADDPAPTDGS
jgi:hypothetical protein